MDLEAGRCRRTDGRKWRCRENVVPDQKYCKGHMNRGSLRSRKPVEAAKNISRSKSPTIICPNKPTKTITSQFNNPSSNTSNNIPSTPETITDSANAKSRGNNNVFVNSDPFSGTVDIKICKGNNSNSSSNSNSNVNASKDITAKNGKDAGFKYINDQKNRNSKNREEDSRVVTPGSGLYRMSVLQGDTEIEERQRCKRTDGRKWRCSREVVPEHKYCDTHMNKGAKRRVTSTLAAPLLATIPKPNTNLSVSPVESPSPQPTSDDDSTGDDSTSSSSSSDATTSTDENAGGVAHIFLLKR